MAVYAPFSLVMVIITWLLLCGLFARKTDFVV
jgi:hypothetical protein